jgi:hypothetical protein
MVRRTRRHTRKASFAAATRCCRALHHKGHSKRKSPPAQLRAPCGRWSCVVGDYRPSQMAQLFEGSAASVAHKVQDGTVLLRLSAAPPHTAPAALPALRRRDLCHCHLRGESLVAWRHETGCCLNVTTMCIFCSRTLLPALLCHALSQAACLASCLCESNRHGRMLSAVPCSRC